MSMQSYDEYLSEVLFEDIELKDLTIEKLTNLESKNGVNIVDQDSIEISLMHKFEPMKILNIVSIFEKVDEFIIIDPFGITMYKGSAEDVIEFVQGFYSDEEI